MSNVSASSSTQTAENGIELGLIIVISCVALMVCLVVTDLSCRKARGIGICGILLLCPSRICGHAVAVFSLRENMVEPAAAPSYEMNVKSKMKILFEMAAEEDDTLKIATLQDASLRDIQLRL